MVTSCQKTLDFNTEAVNLRASINGSTELNGILRYATLAANGHNTQPWKFRLQGQTIEIHPDTSRRLPIVDPQDREQWISLGCALENMAVAAAAAGYSSEIVYPGEHQNFIKVVLHPTTPSTSKLFDAIPFRQSTRSEYREESISQEILAQIHTTVTEPGVELLFIDDNKEKELVLEYINEGNLKQYADKAFVEELISWLRFNKKEALSSMDGLYTKCTGNPTIPRWLGEIFVSGTKPQNQADTDARKLRSSTGAVVLTSQNDTPEFWVRCGQVFERLSLHLTSLDLKSALLNQPIEIPELRGQFQNALGLKEYQPQLIMRYGVAEPLPFSLRRPVEDLLL